jgi:hypothetical protein
MCKEGRRGRSEEGADHIGRGVQVVPDGEVLATHNAVPLGPIYSLLFSWEGAGTHLQAPPSSREREFHRPMFPMILPAFHERSFVVGSNIAIIDCYFKKDLPY